MLKSLKILLIPVLAYISMGISAQEQDLFSSIRSGEVFATRPEKTEVKTGRITTIDDLINRLNQTGFRPNAAGSRKLRLQKSLDSFTFPVLVSLSPDESSVTIVMGLRTVAQREELDSATLLRMLEVSQKHAPFGMAWNRERSRLESYVVLRNERLTGERLRDTINRMAVIASENRSLWFQNTPTKSTQPTHRSTESLVGKWVATRSRSEAFAIEFQADNHFTLVYVNGESQTRSEGTWAVAGSQLTLNGTGLPLRGRLESRAGSAFEFTTENGRTLIFARVDNGNN